MQLTRQAIERSGLTLYAVAKRGGLVYSRVWEVVNRETSSARADTLNRILTACGYDVRLVWRRTKGKAR